MFGNQFSLTADIIKIFSLGFPITYASILLGLPFLAALGYSKHFNMSVVIGSLIHIIGLVLIIPVINIYPVVIMTVVTKTIIFLIRVYGVRRYYLWKNNSLGIN